MIKMQSVVAVVDDDLRILESLENLLESAGYGVRTFARSNEFLTSDYSIVDCLITDIGMPGIDGFGLIEIVMRSMPGLPIFLITGRHEIADQQRAAANGISGLFRKPFDAQRLLSEIGMALSKSDGG